MRKLNVILSFIVFLFAGNLFGQSGWHSTFDNNPHIIYKLVKADLNTVYAFCGNSKFFIKSTDNGESWENHLSFDSAYTITEAFFSNSLTGWINAYYTKSTIMKTTNGGLNWAKINISSSDYYYSKIFFLNENTGWITSYQRLYKTTNAGVSWVELQVTNLGNTTAIKFLNSDTGFISGYNNLSGYIFRTTDSGNSWLNISDNSQLSGTFVSDMQILNQSDVWGIGRIPYPENRTLICKTTNSGITWQTVKNIPDDSNSKYFFYLSFINSSTGYSFGSKSALLKTTDAGASWNEISLNLTTSSNSLLYLNDNSLLLGGGYYPAGGTDLNNYILKSTDQGNNWGTKHNEYYNNFTDVYFKDFNNGLAVSGGGVIHKTTNSGTNWIRIQADSSLPLLKFVPVNKDTLCSVSLTGKIFRTTNFGSSWVESQMPENYGVKTMQFVSSQKGFAVTSAKILKTTDGGQIWSEASSNPIPSNYSYVSESFINENTGWVLSSYNIYQPGPVVIWWTRIYKTTNSGMTWDLVYQNDYSYFTMQSLKFFNDDNGVAVYSTSSYSTTQATYNGGVSWNISPVTPGIYLNAINMYNSSTGWYIGAKNINGNYCTTINKTTNGGFSWGVQYYEQNKTINSIFIKDGNNIWCCGDRNTILKTIDGGGEIISVSTLSTEIPDNFSLSQNYPNPFNPSTKINYELKITNYVTLKVFDLLGKEVTMLVNEKQSAGSYAVDFNSSEFNLPSGIYFYTLNAGEFTETRKMVLIK